MVYSSRTHYKEELKMVTGRIDQDAFNALTGLCFEQGRGIEGYNGKNWDGITITFREETKDGRLVTVADDGRIFIDSKDINTTLDNPFS